MLSESAEEMVSKDSNNSNTDAMILQSVSGSTFIGTDDHLQQPKACEC